MAVTDDTLRLLAQLRDATAALTDSHTRDLIKAYATGWDEVAADLDAALLDLAAGAKDGTITGAQVRQSTRLRKALEVIGRELARLADDAGVLIAGDLQHAVDLAGRTQAALTGSQLPPRHVGGADLLVPWDRVDEAAVRAIIERTTQQIHAATLPLSDEAVRVMKRELVRGVAGGSNPNDTAARMLARCRGEFEGGAVRAIRIARTETLDAMRAAARLSDRANADVVTGWTWVASMTERTCAACWAMHGSVHKPEEPGPLGHQNCLVAGALVTGPRAVASTTRWYDGEVVEIRTDGGRALTVTPNHPMLSAAGWVAAGALREGNYLVCGEGIDRPSGVNGPDDHQMPALIEDVAESLSGAHSVGTVLVPTAAEDFHGDGAGSQVHVVRTDRLLWSDDQPPRLDPSAHLPLFLRGMSRDPRGTHLSGSGSPAQGLVGSLAAAHRGLGREHEQPVLVGSATGRHQPVGIGVRPQVHTCRSQSIVDGRPGHTKSLRQRIAGLAVAVSPGDLGGRQITLGQDAAGRSRGSHGVRLRGGAPEAPLGQLAFEPTLAYMVPSRDSLASFAGQIVTDRIVQVSRRRFSGHVYNLQTSTGWFVANGIITHNCRCTGSPLTKSWAELGFTIPEPPSVLPDGPATFAALGPESQRAILGGKRYDAWQAGDYPMSGWASWRSTSGWRDSIGVSAL